MDLDLAQLRALSTVVAEGSLEAAARVLHVTPSAVSQRLRALETSTGRVLLVRSRPARPTPSGEVLLRLARQLELLAADATAELAGTDERTTLPIAVNADSMATWVLPALAPLAGEIRFDLHREDQARTSALLRAGTVIGAVTADAEPVPGCSVSRLRAMRYVPAASAEFARRWFPDGPDPDAYAAAPVVVFDRADDLQDAHLRTHAPAAAPRRHHVPASADFLQAVRLGFGWGMVPELQGTAPLRSGELVVIDPAGAVDVGLFWQQWKLRSPSLDRVASALREAAERDLQVVG